MCFCQVCQLFNAVCHFVFVFANQSYQDGSINVAACILFGEQSLAGECGGGANDVSIHEFDGLRIQVCNTDLGNGCNAVLQVIEDQQSSDLLGGLGNHLQSHLSDNAQSAFGGYHQVGQRVAGGALGYGLADFHNAAVSQNNGQLQNVVTGGAVLNCTHAACVGSDVAANGRGLGAGVGGIVEAVLVNVSCQILQQNAGLQSNSHVGQVVGQNLVHASSGQNQTAVDGNGCTGQRGAGAANGYGNQIVVADLHDLGNFFGGFYFYNSFGCELAVDGHFVVGVLFLYSFTILKTLFTNNCLELFSNFSGDGVEFCHGFTSLFLANRDCTATRLLSFPFIILSNVQSEHNE